MILEHSSEIHLIEAICSANNKLSSTFHLTLSNAWHLFLSLSPALHISTTTAISKLKTKEHQMPLTLSCWFHKSGRCFQSHRHHQSPTNTNPGKSLTVGIGYSWSTQLPIRRFVSHMHMNINKTQSAPFGALCHCVAYNCNNCKFFCKLCCETKYALHLVSVCRLVSISKSIESTVVQFIQVLMTTLLVVKIGMKISKSIKKVDEHRLNVNK